MGTSFIDKKFLITIAVVGIFYCLFWIKGGTAMFFESAYTKTPANKIEVKTIPQSLTLEAIGDDESYFTSANRSFGKLFRYIKKNKVRMTTPVEAEIEENMMRFYVGKKDGNKELTNNEQVRVAEKSKRMVVSIGLRGSYTKERFESGKAKLNQWLTKHTEYEPVGDFYAVYWNSPFCPGFLKRSEVHIKITAKD
jgi:effector-binding domain-containing protein